MVNPLKWREDWEELSEEDLAIAQLGMSQAQKRKFRKSRISKGRLKLSSRRAKRKAQRIIKRHKAPHIVKRKIEIIARRGQPTGIQEIPDIPGGVVASSWINRITWDDGNFAVMTTIIGYIYALYIPFRLYQEWYWALSKGTFFNKRIKNQYKVKRLSR